MRVYFLFVEDQSNDIWFRQGVEHDQNKFVCCVDIDVLGSRLQI